MTVEFEAGEKIELWFATRRLDGETWAPEEKLIAYLGKTNEIGVVWYMDESHLVFTPWSRLLSIRVADELDDREVG